MRRLEPEFLNALKKGDLLPLLKLVRDDSSLCLELRGDYINVYYRGGNLMKVDHRSSGTHFDFDEDYGAERPEATAGADAWLAAVPRLKHAMDQHEGRGKSRSEREAQQLLLRENNFGRVAQSTDYYICDIEYRAEQGQFDMVGVHWPSTRTDRKNATDRRLVFVEVKYGEGALDGTSGVASHIRHITKFLSDADRVRSFKEDMVKVFNQKRALGLIKCDKDLGTFGDDSDILLVLINQDPDASKLRNVLQGLPESPKNAEVLVANSSPMGYGLWESRMSPLDVYIRSLNASDDRRPVG